MIFSDFLFVCKTTPVFSHPLTRSINSKKTYLNFESLSSLSEDKTNDKCEKFFDPLGASSLNIGGVSTILLNNDSKNVEKTKQKHLILENTSNTKISGIDELAAFMLNNTLNDDIKEEEIDLDSVFINFRPWCELKKKILQTFNTRDFLSIESSFLIAGNLYLTNGRIDKLQETQRYIFLLFFECFFFRVLVGDKSDKVLKFCELTQYEYINKLIKLKKILIYKWKQEKRVECIKV